ncbi:MAG: TolC family protein [Caulobacteraceae bacterium]|nr:TolC family protein [Caulobacteraceae bacterium]
MGSIGAERCATTPLIATPLPVGDGLALIRRRPDIRQAERRLTGETARIGVATADLYPTITLGGTVGTTSTTVGGLGDSNAFRYSVWPLLTWSFPNIGVARARVRQAKARTAAALASFDGVVLAALQDAQSALAAYVRERDRHQALTASRDNAAEAASLSRLRFQRGADDFLTQLDAERALGEAELALTESAAEVAADQVILFQALGGGWEGASMTAPP